MANTKLKLANNILIEYEALKECQGTYGGIAIAEQLASDAIHLAQIITEENNHMRTLLIDDMRNIDCSVIVRTYDDGITALKDSGPFDILYLDHDLGDDDFAKTGYGIMNFLEANPQYLPKEIILVTSNPVGRKQMQVVIERLYGNKEVS